MNTLKWTCKKFEELSVEELYMVLRLRCEVFVVEQNCPYLDPDNKDQGSLHLMGKTGEQLVAYARLIPPGISYPESSIGRVVSSPSARRTGAGKELMNEAIRITYESFENAPIRIGAQLYLKKFYEELGFTQASEQYLEDGIPHIEMTHSK